MSFWKTIKDAAVVSRRYDERLHELALREMQSGDRRDGLWAKALIEGQGDEGRAQAVYLRLLVTALQDEHYVSERVSERNRQLASTKTVGDAQARDPVVSSSVAIPRPVSGDVEKTKPKSRFSTGQREIIDRLMKIVESGEASENTYKVLVEFLGGRIDRTGLINARYTVVISDKKNQVGSLEDLKVHFMDRVFPLFNE